MLFKSLTVVAAAGLAAAQSSTSSAAMAAPTSAAAANMSICDFYTTALLMNNTAANQKTLLTLVVNTAVIGNYTKPNVGVMVPGILAQGTVNGTAVDLLPYFDGGLKSSNRGGMSGVAVNFLDDGGAAPLMKNMPANGTSSNQYMLLTHLYEYFGALTGCSMQGGADYSAYTGEGSMYEVHKFMDLSEAEFTYFVTQVALSAMSFGVAKEDIATVGTALTNAFGYKCAAAMTIIPSQGAQLQSICSGDGCPTAVNQTCSANMTSIGEPAVANASLVPSVTVSGTTKPTGTATGAATGTSTSASPSSTTNAAAVAGLSFAAVAGGFAALLL